MSPQLLRPERRCLHGQWRGPPRRSPSPRDARATEELLEAATISPKFTKSSQYASFTHFIMKSNRGGIPCRGRIVPSWRPCVVRDPRAFTLKSPGNNIPVHVLLVGVCSQQQFLFPAEAKITFRPVKNKSRGLWELQMAMWSPPFSASAASLFDTLSCPPGTRKASFSLRLHGGAPGRLPLSFFTDDVMPVLPQRSWRRIWTAAKTSRVNVTRLRTTAAIRAEGASPVPVGLAVGLPTEYSQRAPMKPAGHWHTGPGNWSQGLVRTEQSLPVKPSVHVQLKALAPSTQVPALRQGAAAQSSTLVSQRGPVKPGRQRHMTRFPRSRH
ncbi:hypothetical protein EYF80_018690 [Liparis tanakae]|uniref:Uncharacterized protein n=1 Tax=Liparis tanakae TaxID=230148 RepID=A0A4Z2HYU3_9TELE|nr:hypothetical protein EYF80_018690 [Liparis tanakae]